MNTTTWNSLAPTTTFTDWEYHTAITVAIFSFVCLLNLSALMYAICFHCHRNPCNTTSLTHHLPPVENETTTFHPSLSHITSNALDEMDTIEQQGRHIPAMFPSISLRQV